MGVGVLRHARSKVSLLPVVVTALPASKTTRVFAERLMTVLRESAVFFSVRAGSAATLTAGSCYEPARVVPLPSHGLRRWHRSTFHWFLCPSPASLTLVNPLFSLALQTRTPTLEKSIGFSAHSLAPSLFFQDRNYGPHTSFSFVPPALSQRQHQH